MTDDVLIEKILSMIGIRVTRHRKQLV